MHDGSFAGAPARSRSEIRVLRNDAEFGRVDRRSTFSRSPTLRGVEITCVTIDCANAEAVAAFWNEALNWGGVAAAPDGSGAVCGPPGGGIYLEFVRVPETKTRKNRVHLGCAAGY